MTTATGRTRSVNLAILGDPARTTSPPPNPRHEIFFFFFFSFFCPRVIIYSPVAMRCLISAGEKKTLAKKSVLLITLNENYELKKDENRRSERSKRSKRRLRLEGSGKSESAKLYLIVKYLLALTRHSSSCHASTLITAVISSSTAALQYCTVKESAGFFIPYSPLLPIVTGENDECAGAPFHARQWCPLLFSRACRPTKQARRWAKKRKVVFRTSPIIFGGAALPARPIAERTKDGVGSHPPHPSFGGVRSREWGRWRW